MPGTIRSLPSQSGEVLVLEVSTQAHISHQYIPRQTVHQPTDGCSDPRRTSAAIIKEVIDGFAPFAVLREHRPYGSSPCRGRLRIFS